MFICQDNISRIAISQAKPLNNWYNKSGLFSYVKSN